MSKVSAYAKKIKGVKGDPKIYIEAVCGVCKVNEAQLFAPIRTREREALAYVLYRHTPLPIDLIADTLCIHADTAQRWIIDFGKTVSMNSAFAIDENYFLVKDIREYAIMLNGMKKPQKESPKKKVRELVEGAGIDYLEYIRWPRKKQIEWLKSKDVVMWERKKKKWQLEDED